jgi:predicted AAA+ superfamily ATPase
VEKVSRYDLKGKKILQTSEKFYLGEHGLRQASFGYSERDIGQILENIIYLELKRRGYKVFIGKFDNFEIDFVAEKNGKIEYYQVSYLLTSQKTIDREFQILEKIKDSFPKFVLTLDSYLIHNPNGIVHMNIIDFLMKN